MSSDWGSDGENITVYNCPSCGAEIICDSTTAATSCPYCDNPTIVPNKLSGTLKPNYVIPFKLNKDDAVAALKKFYKKKALLPKVFKSENHIQEIKGMYVPFWLFDSKADADIEFAATRTHVSRSGDEEITTTEHYVIHRAGTVDFNKIPADASEKMPDDYMDALEPYDYADLKEFSTAYLPGYMADRYDVEVSDCFERADKRAGNTTMDIMRGSVVGYDSVEILRKSVSLKRGKVNYALLPVWMLNTKWKDKNYMFAVNGQTGKIVGELPVDKGRYWAWFAAIAAPLAAIIGLISFL